MSRTNEIGPVKKILFTVIIIPFFFLMLELVLRLASLGSGPYLQAVPDGGPTDPYLYQPANNRIYKLLPKAEGEYRGRAGPVFHYRINSFGFHGPEITREKPRGTFRIICMGDSCTFGAGIGMNELPYPGILERILNDSPSGLRFEVINAGVPGYNTIDGSYWLRDELLGFSPDLVVIMYGWNDHWLVDRPHYDEAVKSSKIVTINDVFSRLNTYRIMSRIIYGLKWKSSKKHLSSELRSLRFEVLPDRYWNNLDLMIREARSGGARVLLMTSPSGLVPGKAPVYLLKLGAVKSLETLPGLHETYNNVVRKLAAERGTLFLDLVDVFGGNEDEYYTDRLVDPIHPNNAGYTRIASELATVVRREVFQSE